MSEDFDPERELLGEEDSAATSSEPEGSESETVEVSETAESTNETGSATEDAEAPTEPSEEEKAKAAAEAAAKKEADEKAKKERADAFVNAVETLVVDKDKVDKETGVVAVGHMGDVRAAYLALQARERKAATDYLAEKMQQYLLEDDADRARAYLELKRHLSTAKPEPIVKEKVNPTEAHVNAVVAMRLAGNFVPVPDGVDEDWTDKVQALGKTIMESGDVATYKTWLDENEGKKDDEKSPEPEVHEVVKLAAQIGRGRARARVARAPRTPGEKKERAPRAPRVGDGTRRNIAEHIREAFASEAIGTFLTVAEIAKFSSTEYAGTEGPSQGAINARLFPASGAECKLDFVKPEGPLQGRPQKGAVKVA